MTTHVIDVDSWVKVIAKLETKMARFMTQSTTRATAEPSSMELLRVSGFE